MLRPRGTGRILNRLKKLTGHFVHTEPFNIFAPFSSNCRIVIFPSKASNSRTRKSMFAILCLQSSFFSSCVAKYLGNYTVAEQKFSRTWCSQLTVQIFDSTGQKFDLDFSVQIFVRLGWFRLDRTPKQTNFQPAKK